MNAPSGPHAATREAAPPEAACGLSNCCCAIMSRASSPRARTLLLLDPSASVRGPPSKGGSWICLAVFRAVEPTSWMAPDDREGTTRYRSAGWKHQLRLLLRLEGTLALMAKATVPRLVARFVIPYPPRPGDSCIWTTVAALSRCYTMYQHRKHACLSVLGSRFLQSEVCIELVALSKRGGLWAAVGLKPRNVPLCAND